MDPLSILLSWNPIDWIMQPVNDIKQTIDLLLLGFKLVVLLFIVQFVRNRFSGGPIVTVLVLVIGYIFLFQMWPLFGSMMLVYLLIFFGFSMLVMDLAIAKPWARGGAGGEEEGEHMSGKQYQEETAKRQAMRGRFFR